MKDISEKGKVIPSKVTGRLDDDKYDKRILTLVNKIEGLDENNTPLKPKTTSNVTKSYWKKVSCINIRIVWKNKKTKI